MTAHGVLHVLGTAQPEGAGIAHLVRALASGLDRERYRLHALFLGGPGPLAAELKATGIAASAIDWRRGARDPMGAWRCWRELVPYRFAIIHQHVGGRSVRWVARRSTGARILVHLHGGLSGPSDSRPAIRGADAIVACSQSVARSVPSAHSRVVYAGVGLPTRVTPRSAKRAPLVGTACRLVPEKGIVHLLRALATIRAELPSLCLEIAGSGPARAAIEDEIGRLGLQSSVTLLGWQPNLVDVLSRWGIFVLPSLAEGFPIVALEAMAAGLPVVATRVGGIPELVEHGRTGWLVPAADPSALAQCLRALILNGEQRRAMGLAGQARVRDRFSVEQMVATVSNIYDDLANEALSPKPVSAGT